MYFCVSVSDTSGNLEIFLEVQLLSNSGVTHRFTHPLTHLLTDNVTFVVRFGRSLQFFHLEFYKEAISDGFMDHSRVLRGGVNFRVHIVIIYISSYR